MGVKGCINNNGSGLTEMAPLVVKRNFVDRHMSYIHAFLFFRRPYCANSPISWDCLRTRIGR